jgi:hypothetical protein
VKHAWQAKRIGIGAAVCLALSVLIGSCPEALAQRVELKRTFFRGWRYSIDSSDWKKLGAQAVELRAVMKDYRICITSLNSYKSHVTAAKITGLTSAFLIGFPIVAKLRGKEWIDGYTPMVVVGGTLAISSLALEAAGSRRLKKALLFYNRYKGYTGLDRLEIPEYTVRKPGWRITLGLRF